MDVVVLQHWHALNQRMSREQSNVMRRDACRMKLCGQDAAEAMETNAFGKAKIFEVINELVQKTVAIPAIASTTSLVLAGTQVREMLSGMRFASLSPPVRNTCKLNRH